MNEKELRERERERERYRKSERKEEKEGAIFREISQKII